MSDWVRILGVDPGKRTGIAVVFWDRDTDELHVDVSEEIDDWNEAGARIEAIIEGGFVEEVVTEDFVILKKTAGQWSILLNGVTCHSAWKAGVPLTGQNSQRAKVFSTDAKLKALGISHPTKGGHANDAIRHVLLWLTRNGFADRRMVV